MLFNFLKYLHPTHYFQCYTKSRDSIFPRSDKLPTEILAQLKPDASFKSITAQNYDVSWQAIQLGYIGDAQRYIDFDTLSVFDNYVFIRKYFHNAWVFYVFIIRVFSFKNIIREFSAYFGTRHIKRNSYLKQPIEYSSWRNYNSQLLIENPKVSVIIPTLNRYRYLKDVLHDLELQDYKNFEVIIIDQSDVFQEHFYNAFNLDLIVENQKEKALWLARNKGVKKADGNYLLFFDDDSRVKNDWIKNHLKCIDFFGADISSGVSISNKGARVPENYSFFRISDQLDTGNVLIKKSVFKSIGLFDRQFEKQRMGDGEFGLRAFLFNFRNISNPHAERFHLKVSSGGLRQMGSWDAFRSKKWFAPIPIPSVLYFFRSYFGNVQSRYELLKSVPLSILPYRFKRNRVMLFIGVFVSFFMLPIIVIQVYLSWKLATKKIKQGPLITKLD